MKLNNWHVMTKDNVRSYFYGDLSEFEPDELDGYVEVPYDSWIAEDFTEVLGNILEDRNHHWMTDMPKMLFEVCTEALISEDSRTFILQKFSERMEREKFL